MAGPPRSGRIEGWSRAPYAARLPALLLVAVVCLAAIVRESAAFVFIALLFAYFLSRRFGGRSLDIAAVLPAAAILLWRSIPQPLADASGADCADLLSPPALWRFMEAALGLVVLAVLVRDRRASLGELGFRRGSRRVRLVAFAGLLLIAPIAIVGGTILGRAELGGIFFGSYAFDFSQPAAIIPALIFAGSNALAEELAYRGAMRVWLAPSLGILGANLAQAIVFGFAHTGEDFVGLEGAIPTMLAMVAVAFVGGIIARRTGSLTIPLAFHAAADIPIYFYWACRVA